MTAATKPGKPRSKPKVKAAKKEAPSNGQASPKLSPEARKFVERTSGKDGVALKDHILIAIKDGEDHTVTDLFKKLKEQVPANVVVADPENAAAKDLKAGRRAILAAALESLRQAQRVTVKGEAGDGTWADEAKIKLVPPAADERFEIDEEFKKLLPPQTASEIAALEQMLLMEGCRDPLIVCELDNKTFLIDGHTRMEICLRHGINYEVRSIDLADRAAVIDWIWNYQYSQRNLTRVAESYHRGRYINALNLQHGGDRKSKAQDELLNAKEVAAKFNVSRATIVRDATFARSVDTIADACGTRANEFRGQLLSGVIRLPAGKVKLLAEKDKAERAQAAKKLLGGERIKLGTTKGKAYLRVALPRGKPEEQAQALWTSLKRAGVEKLIEQLKLQLETDGKPKAEDGEGKGKGSKQGG